jgi:hypothetical protein
MADPINIVLQRSGVLTQPPLLSGHTRPWGTYGYGEFYSSHIGLVDEYADAIKVRRPTEFFRAPEREGPQEWHDASDGLRTFESLVTEMIGRIGSNDSFTHAEGVLWDLRAYELILRTAARDGDRFYLDV